MANSEIVKSMYAAFGRGDVAGVINVLSDDVEWDSPGSSVIPYAGHYKGKAAVTGFFQKLAETCEFEPFVIEQYVEQGDVVVALGSNGGHAKGSKVSFAGRWAMVFTFKNGKVVRFDEYLDTAAIEASFASVMAAKA